VRADAGDWEKEPFPGIEVRQLLGRNTMLIRIAPKSWYPAHDHETAEQCLILEGSMTAEGITANAGDYVYMPKGSSHPALYSETGCLMLVAYT
jgi:anti-sigma factor ChrR (cupin superfamily)